MNLSEIIKKIKPCDRNKPYLFVSYSSEDRGVVWPDVLRFQQMGYNVWMDEKNLDKTKASWKEDALRAIEDLDCSMVIFYVSSSSLVSEACYRELSKTTEETTVAFHYEPVRFIAIDAEQVGNIGTFTKELHKSVKNSQMLTKDKKAQMFLTLHHFMKDFFDSNNEKVRIHPKNEPKRKMDYYEEIMASFPEETKNQPVEMFGIDETKDLEKIKNYQKEELKKTFVDTIAKRKKQLAGQEKADLEKWYREGYQLFNQEKYEKALELFVKAGKMGHANAQSMAAYQYYNGKGCAQDYGLAFIWYQEAAKQGNTTAQYGLACCYYNGKGTSKDYDEAFSWFMKGAQKGDTGCEYMTGVCYYFSLGVGKDLKEAEKWLKKAVDKNHNDAKKYYDIVLKELNTK